MPRGLRAILPARDGIAALEFGLLGPIFCLLLAGSVDFGGVIYVKLALDAGVSAASNYALNAGTSTNSSSGPAFASNLAAVVASSHSANWANASVTVNHGPTATVVAGVTTSGGTAANADSCYCPTAGPSGLIWGSAVGCGSACSDGSEAGKFVVISATHTYAPIFSNYGLIQNGTISSSITVQVQ